jgi:hypothetical protein
MITEGLPSVHTAECRALKAALERGAGLRFPAQGHSTVQPETIYIDAPVGLGLEYLADVGSMAEYTFFLRPAPSGTFVDGYNHRVAVTSRQYTMGEMSLIEHELAYIDDNVVRRSVTLLVP